MFLYVIVGGWNERHYGSLQGLNKAETTKKYGDEQVHIWRRSYTTPPPELISMMKDILGSIKIPDLDPSYSCF